MQGAESIKRIMAMFETKNELIETHLQVLRDDAAKDIEQPSF